MNPIARKKIRRSLSEKGFRPEGDNWYLWYEGQKTNIRVKISSGQEYREFGDAALKFKKQPLRLQTLKQVKDLFICPTTGEQYIAYLLSEGITL